VSKGVTCQERARHQPAREFLVPEAILFLT
jgi:hypothetical protein